MPNISHTPPLPGEYAYRVAMAVMDDLPGHLHKVRVARGASLRRVARESGLSNVTIARAEAGEGIDLGTAQALLAWMVAA